MKKIEVTNIVVEGIQYEVAAVVGVEGYYASRCGKVFSTNGRGSKGMLKEVGALNRWDGRIVVTLYCDGKKTCSRGRVVCSAWSGVDVFTPLHCLHLDGDSLNDCADNLEFDTASENSRDRVRHGSHNLQKLTYVDCREIIRLYSTGEYSQRELGLMYGVVRTSIQNVIRNHRKDLTYYDETEHEATELKNAA